MKRQSYRKRKGIFREENWRSEAQTSPTSWCVLSFIQFSIYKVSNRAIKMFLKDRMEPMEQLVLG